MKKSVSLFFALLLSAFMACTVFADQLVDIPEADSYLDEEAAANADVMIEHLFSNPEVSISDGIIEYRTTILLRNMNTFYGYQIEVDGLEDEVEIQNRSEGVVTPLVYKAGTANLASLASETATGDIEVCEIVCRYPVEKGGQERQLTVGSLRIVTSIMAEHTQELGPLSITLPEVEIPETPASYWQYIGLAVALLLLASVGLWLYRKKKSQTSSES